MTKRTFRQAFNTKFHSDTAYQDFRNSGSSNRVEKFTLKNGREVFKLEAQQKGYLQFVDGVVLRYLEKDEDVVHSFIKQRSTLTAVRVHSGSKYFFLTDIEQFYSNIKRSDVIDVFTRNVTNIPISDIANHIEFLADITTHNNCLPVGFPTSPMLSNAFLFDFDERVKAFCESKNLVYTRYADDIIISSPDTGIESTLRDIVQKLLKEHASESLILNNSKTKITHIGNKVKLLGLVVLPNGRITIDSKYKKHIEVTLHFFANDTDKYRDLLAKHFKGSEHSLFGLLHYANSIDPSYIDKLQRKYGAFALRDFMENKWHDKG